MTDIKKYKLYNSLHDVAAQFKNNDIFGHKLTYFCNDYCPYFIKSKNIHDQNVDAFSKEIDINNPNNQCIFHDTYDMDLIATQGCNYFLGFDNGEYLYVDCYGDCQLTLWITTDKDDNECFGPHNGFYLDKFFDACVGATLVDVDILVSEYYSDIGVDCKIYEDGTTYFLGQLKLVFDNGKSLLFGAVDGSTYIKQLDQNGNIDICNYWHVAKCFNLNEICYTRSNIDDVNDCLYQKFGSLYTNDIKAKIASFNKYQMTKFYDDFILSTKISSLDIDVVKKYADYCFDHPSADFGNPKILGSYAKYICDLINRRDILDESYLLSHIRLISKMQDILDHIVSSNGSIKADEIMAYINSQNKTKEVTLPKGLSIVMDDDTPTLLLVDGPIVIGEFNPKSKTWEKASLLMKPGYWRPVTKQKILEITGGNLPSSDEFSSVFQ